ncbi:hypothetical protein Srut_38400 [Streptomyces rutgersensis]|nr:hypothetical protein Srut_38400 [Streptomyces rutgersensis]
MRAPSGEGAARLFLNQRGSGDRPQAAPASRRLDVGRAPALQVVGDGAVRSPVERFVEVCREAGQSCRAFVVANVYAWAEA